MVKVLEVKTHLLCVDKSKYLVYGGDADSRKFQPEFGTAGVKSS